MGALTADNILTDVDEALAYLSEAGIADSNTGVVGFCMGGTVTLAVATMREVGAASRSTAGASPPDASASPRSSSSPTAARSVAGPVRGPRPGHPGRRRRAAARRGCDRRGADRDRALPRRRPRLPLRPALELSRRVRARHVEPHARLVRPAPALAVRRLADPNSVRRPSDLSADATKNASGGQAVRGGRRLRRAAGSGRGRSSRCGSARRARRAGASAG